MPKRRPRSVPATTTPTSSPLRARSKPKLMAISPTQVPVEALTPQVDSSGGTGSSTDQPRDFPLPPPSRLRVRDFVEIFKEITRRNIFSKSELMKINDLLKDLEETDITKSRRKEVNDTLKELYSNNYKLIRKRVRD